MKANFSTLASIKPSTPIALNEEEKREMYKLFERVCFDFLKATVNNVTMKMANMTQNDLDYYQ